MIEYMCKIILHCILIKFYFFYDFSEILVAQPKEYKYSNFDVRCINLCHDTKISILYRYGLLGKKFKDMFGHLCDAILGGLVALKKPDNHGIPYSLTEEFVSVYRMHALLPDSLHLRDISATPGHNKSPPLIKEYAKIFLPQHNLLYFFNY